MKSSGVTLGSNYKSLLEVNKNRIASLGKISPDMSEVMLLRFALQFQNQEDAERALRETIKWRSSVIFF